MTGRLAVHLGVALPLKQVVPARAQMGSSLVTVGAVSGTVLSFDTGLRPPRECDGGGAAAGRTEGVS